MAQVGSRRGRAGTAFLLVPAAVVLGSAHRSWIVAQMRVVVTLAAAWRTPVLGWAVRLLTRKPRIEETTVAGVPTTLVCPGAGGPRPAFVFVNGVTARGRHHPEVQRLARGLARAGYLVAVPDLPGLRQGQLTDRTVDAAVMAVITVAAREGVRRDRVGFLAVSVGTTVALLAAEDPRLADRLSIVAGLAPYTDLVNVIRLATTGAYPANGGLTTCPATPLLSLVVARSVVAGMPDGPDRRLLAARLAGMREDAADPLAPLCTLEAPLSPVGRAVVELLLNRDSGRFECLYAALPPSMHAAVERLSPLVGAGRLGAPVELATAPRDTYFPAAESRALARVAPHARVTVTSALAHADPKPVLDDLAGFLRFDAFAVRVLHAARI